jgi:hypothetical protein
LIKEEHLWHIWLVLQTLCEKTFYANLKKWSFFANEVNFLGHIITVEGIKVYPSKIEAINNWSTSKYVHDIRSFHKLASLYKRFIKNFSSIAALLT